MDVKFFNLSRLIRLILIQKHAGNITKMNVVFYIGAFYKLKNYRKITSDWKQLLTRKMKLTWRKAFMKKVQAYADII